MFKVFISHTHSDRPLADALRNFLEETFTEHIRVYYSSAKDVKAGIQPGAEWLQWIHQNLRECNLCLVLLSQRSLLKPWLIWESGAVLGMNLTTSSSIRIVPILFGINANQIPSPLKACRLQVMNGSCEEELNKLYTIIFDDIKNNVSSSYLNEVVVKKPQASQTYLSRIEAHLSSENPKLSISELIRFLEPLPDLSRLIKCLETLPNLRDINPHLLSQLLIKLAEVGGGQYNILGVANVYRHDSEVIKCLKAGDTYRATHPFIANPEAMDQRILNRNAFQNYIKIQIEAANRGVKVTRIYIVPDHYNLDNLQDIQRKHLESLLDSQIEIKLISEQNIDLPDGISYDCVLINTYCIGTGVPPKGVMFGSKYQIHPPSQPSELYLKHDKFFNELYSQSVSLEQCLQSKITTMIPPLSNNKIKDIKNYQEQRELAQMPAFVTKTNANINGSKVQRLMIVLRTNGCSYDKGKKGCTMCDFRKHAIDIPVEAKWMMSQFKSALAKVQTAKEQIEQIDLLTLGSFLYDGEISPEFRHTVMKYISQIPEVKKVVIESRATYVNLERLEFIKQCLRKDQILELGIGVETSNEYLRQEILRKGMPWSILERAIESCKNADVHFQAYLLIGTQRLSEIEAIEDAVRSAEDVVDLCLKYSVPFKIAFEPVFITKGTPLEELYIKKEYKLINLWSVVEVLRRTHHLGTIFVGMSDEGLSDGRIPEGCPLCTQKLRDAIEEFNGSQDIKIFDSIICNQCNPG
ncbi:TIR domain-containing protein [Nostoc sp. TCL240-02]|uniref:TIR domain-containing protein n=1 Tax=Nostoc sp. TCL240-02 TaxID=2572090 RepID=UPI00157F814B|nr:TIR domain-containing protein [Nostoc sp. TCL240-02]